MATDKVGFEFAPHGVVPGLDPKLYSLHEQEAAFFKSATDIQDDEELKKHILDVQAKAYVIFGYPCIRRFSFLRLNICKLQANAQVLKLTKECQGAVLLDIGCCFGNDLRKAVADGWAMQNAIASDLRQGFRDAWHELFKTTPVTYPLKFVPGDAFDPAFIAPRDPCYELPPTPAPELQSLTSLSPLQRSRRCSSCLCFGTLVQQTQVCKALASLLSLEPRSTIFGAHGGYRRRDLEQLTWEAPPEECSSTIQTAGSGMLKKGSVRVEAQLVQHKREDFYRGIQRREILFYSLVGDKAVVLSC